MSSPPPRRSRPPSNQGSLPFLPIVLGVLILGFLIGAGVSLVNRNRAQAVSVATPAPDVSEAPVTAAPTVPPTPEPTDEPATPKPAATPEPAATAEPEATDTPDPTEPPTRKPAATAAPTAAHASAEPASSAAAAASAAPTRDAETAAPAATPRATAAPVRPPVLAAPTRVPATAQPTRAPATAAPTAAATAAPTDAESAFERQATSVVRTYLAAVERGDVDGAQAQLASARGALPEVGIVDPGTQLRNLESRGTEDAVTVNVDLQTKSGLYLGQYVVHRTAGGAAVIVDHTLVKS